MTFNGSVYVDIFESGRISLYECVMYFKSLLTVKMKWLILK